MKDFHGKVAAITGAGSGIGRALALDLAGRGAQLALADIQPGPLAETGRLCAARGAKVTEHQLDVADRAAVFAFADAVVAGHGAAHLIFNNAGVALGSSVDGTRLEDFQWLMNINFWGVVHGTQAFLPHLRKSGEGHVINISSIFGIVAIPQQSVYNAAKFAVRGYTEALRMELDLERQMGATHRVSATTVHPGGIKTNIAKSARVDRDALKAMNIDPDEARRRFEKNFITSPEKAAATILRGVAEDARRVLIGPDARALDLMARFLPSLYQPLVMRLVRRNILGS